MTNPELSKLVANLMDVIVQNGLEDRVGFANRINSAQDFNSLSKSDKKIIISAESSIKSLSTQAHNSSYLQEAADYLILQDAAVMLNANCKDEEKVGSGPGSCGGEKVSDNNNLNHIIVGNPVIPLTKKGIDVNLPKIIRSKKAPSIANKQTIYESGLDALNSRVSKWMTVENGKILYDTKNKNSKYNIPVPVPDKNNVNLFTIQKGQYVKTSKGIMKVISSTLNDATGIVTVNGKDRSNNTINIKFTAASPTTQFPIASKKEFDSFDTSKISKTKDKLILKAKQGIPIAKTDKAVSDLLYNTLTPASKNAFTEYTEFATDINNYLVSGKTDKNPTDLERIIYNIKRTISKAELVADIVLLKGAGKKSFDSILNNVDKNDIFKYNVFMSTTTNKSIANKFASLDEDQSTLRSPDGFKRYIEVRAHKGDNALFMTSTFSEHSNEKEYLFAPGQDFKMIDYIKNDKDKTMKIILETVSSISRHKQNSSLLADAASFISLNRQGKCPRGTVDDSFKCGDEEPGKEKEPEFIGFKPDHDFSGKNIEIDPKIQTSLDRAASPLKTMDSEERQALKGYTGVAYKTINDYLSRGLKDAPDYIIEETKQNIDKLDKIFSHAELKEPLIVYRGIKDSIIVDNPELREALDTPGSEVQFPCFTSSSAMPYVANNFAEGYNGRLVKLQLPIGTKAIYISGKGPFGLANEFEILINRNTKFEVIETTYTEIKVPKNFSNGPKRTKVTTLKAIV